MNSNYTNSIFLIKTRVLKFAGAVRLSQIVEGVTHVVAAEKDSGSLMQNMNPLCSSPPIVDLQWLVNSMERGEPAPLDDDQDHCQPAEDTQIEAKIEGCNEEEGRGFEEKLLAQYAALGVPRNQTAYW